VNTAQDAFIGAFIHSRHRRFVELAETAAIGSAVLSVLAWVTSLDILRYTALFAWFSCLVPLSCGLFWRSNQPDLRRVLLRGSALSIASALILGLTFTLQGLGLGFERHITELPAARVRVADIDARRHPEQNTILTLLAEARSAPSLATLRPMIPLMRLNHQFVTDEKGDSIPVSVAVREVLMVNPGLLQRSLHDEIVTMAGLLPLDGPVPPQVEVDVADRLRSALGLLLELHVEHRMQRRFELPTVGMVLDTVVADDQHGAREVRYEVGLTYSFADFAARQDVNLNYAAIMALLDMVRGDLSY
jgi:hypothetical protein